MTSDDITLEAAVAALHDAEQALRAARRNLTAAIAAAYRSGEPVARIAERTGSDVIAVRNTLAAAGASRHA
ncbi:hypothetical protein [Streptomyces sp. NPDC057909]|uniref:hypothetical protein n=1 Tax=Streptomyces sp. NPDC057909 TaxID=3346277 RepID=UPI0036EDC62B